MFSFNGSKTGFVAIFAVAVTYCAVSQKLIAASPATTAPDVKYSASGTFASPPISGTDLYKLQGQPFSISVVANAATAPSKHGAQWAQYNDLGMTGTVQSGLVPTPITISNNSTDILLATGNPNVNIFQLGSPIRVVGLVLTITASISMPKSTITNALIHPFSAPVTLTPANALMTYSDGTNTTTLGINGTLNARITGAAATPEAAAPMLHSAGLQLITGHGDGTQSVRSVGTNPVDLGAPPDTTVLRFYASGVREASDVHVSIAGVDVPVLYAGAADHFPGLDQVSIQVPPDLAGRGAVDVVLTVNGQPAPPVRIHIQ